MTKSIYLVNPASDAPTYYAGDVYHAWGFAPAACMADLAVVSVAAFVPDDFEVRVCDENVQGADLDTEVDFVGITGKVSQWGRMRELARAFRERGRTVVIGGPFASLCPETVAEHCDVLVRGELEGISEELFDDLRAGTWKNEYVGGKPSLDASPVPRWDLYPNDRAEWGAVQTSRGCPFECEFCDVIAYLGRKQRHKPVEHVLAELDELYRHGYRNVFLADDNLTAHRRSAKELLAALAGWNARQRGGRVHFSTQVSIDTAADEELLQIAAGAGLGSVFIGIETPNVESLRESKKRQNLGIDLVERVRRFQERGILVMGGMMVGFDADGPDIFRRQLEFATQAALPIVTLGALVAPPATPLHARMRAEGRLLEDGTGAEIAATPWHSNIVPKGMTREQLFTGIRWLSEELYAPAPFTERMLRFVEIQRSAPRFAARTAGPVRTVDRDLEQLIGSLAALGPAEAEMVTRLTAAARDDPRTAVSVAACLRLYAQIQHMHEVAWGVTRASA